MLLTEGQASDHRGGALILPRLPPARYLIADRGYDSKPFRDALTEHGISACIMRYDRCAHTVFSAITLAAIVIFWLKE